MTERRPNTQVKPSNGSRTKLAVNSVLEREGVDE